MAPNASKSKERKNCNICVKCTLLFHPKAELIIVSNYSQLPKKKPTKDWQAIRCNQMDFNFPHKKNLIDQTPGHHFLWIYHYYRCKYFDFSISVIDDKCEEASIIKTIEITLQNSFGIWWVRVLICQIKSIWNWLVGIFAFFFFSWTL